MEYNILEIWGCGGPSATPLILSETMHTPDKAKIQAFADSLRELPLPALKTKQVLGLLPVKIEELAVWVESQIARL